MDSGGRRNLFDEGTVTSQKLNSVSRQNPKSAVSRDASTIGSTFFGRYFKANPKPARQSAIVDNVVDEEPLSHRSSVGELAERFSDVLIVESKTDFSKLYLDVDSKLNRLRNSTLGKIAGSEKSDILLPGLGKLLCVPKFTESATQTADPLEGWSWYPFRAELLRHPTNLTQNSSLKVHVSAVIDPKFLFLSRNEDASTLTQMSEEMAQMAELEHIGVFSEIPPVDFVVCVWNIQAKRWSRGIILERFPANALVFYVDFGTVAKVTLGDIRQIKANWIKCPREVFCVELEDVASPPGGFFPESSITVAEKLLILPKIQLIFSVSKVRGGGDLLGKLQIGNGTNFKSVAEIYSLYGILSE